MIEFRKARRERIPLLVGLSGSSGSGKTYSALELATGLAGGKRFAMIDTENGRARHYADQFDFDCAEMSAPFSPQNYSDHIAAADKAGYPVIIIDSMSHEHSGEGGLLDWHEEELERMAQGDMRRREAVNMKAWVKPKIAHKRMMASLLQCKAHLVMCFRAEEKVAMVKEGGKTKIVDVGWRPICEKNVPYEMSLSLLFTDDAPGVPKPIKLPTWAKSIVSTRDQIAMRQGELLAEWALGVTIDPGVVESLRDGISRCERTEDLVAIAQKIQSEPESVRQQLRGAFLERKRALESPERSELSDPGYGPPPLSDDEAERFRAAMAAD